MSKIEITETELFSEVYLPKSFGEFASLLRGIDLSYGNPRYWRGQANIEWPLHSTAVRRLKSHIQKKKESPMRFTERPLEEWMRDYEKRLLDQARAAGYDFLSSRRLSDLQLLATLQHFGAATRLLDFTHNALIALWFACHDNRYDKDCGLVIGLNDTPTHFKHLTSEHQANMSFFELLDLYKGHNLIWKPVHEYSRMQAQQGLFVLGEVKLSSWSSLPVRSDDLICIGILPELKEDMKTLWSSFFGYSIKNLFPDIEGFSRHHSWNKDFAWDFFR